MSPKASITVLYFAGAQTATGLFSETIPIPHTTDDSSPGLPLSNLSSILSERHSKSNLKSILETSAWSIDAEMIDPDDVPNIVLKGGEEVAVICPVSGG
jgi:molybdopterin synthase sulfur carrier subunit